MGIVPNLFLRPMGPSIERMLSRVQLRAPVFARSGDAPGSPVRPAAWETGGRPDAGSVEGGR
jgi:hypothetical protein